MPNGQPDRRPYELCVLPPCAIPRVPVISISHSMTKSRWGQWPVLAYNLPGLRGDLKFKRDVYVDIFKITRWNGPRIAENNPDLRLPSDDIALGARADSSGTTFAFTSHLSAISDAWRHRDPGVV